LVLTGDSEDKVAEEVAHEEAWLYKQAEWDYERMVLQDQIEELTTTYAAAEKHGCLSCLRQDTECRIEQNTECRIEQLAVMQH
jgi:DNA-binding transcriptional regulator YbjK